MRILLYYIAAVIGCLVAGEILKRLRLWTSHVPAVSGVFTLLLMVVTLLSTILFLPIFILFIFIVRMFGVTFSSKRPFVRFASQGFHFSSGPFTDENPHGEFGERFYGLFNRNSGMSYEESLATLGLSGEPTEFEVHAAYKKLMKQHHPDLGGDPKMAAKLNQARDILLKK